MLPWFYILLLLSVFSLPAVADLMETCIDDVLRAPVVPVETAADEAGPSYAYGPPSATGEDPLCLAGEATDSLQPHGVGNKTPQWQLVFRNEKCDLRPN